MILWLQVISLGIDVIRLLLQSKNGNINLMMTTKEALLNSNQVPSESFQLSITFFSQNISRSVMMSATSAEEDKEDVVIFPPIGLMYYPSSSVTVAFITYS